MIQLTLIVVALSILLHGISVKPLMGMFWRRDKPREPAAAVANEANPTKQNA